MFLRMDVRLPWETQPADTITGNQGMAIENAYTFSSSEPDAGRTHMGSRHEVAHHHRDLRGGTHYPCGGDRTRAAAEAIEEAYQRPKGASLFGFPSGEGGASRLGNAESKIESNSGLLLAISDRISAPTPVVKGQRFTRAVDPVGGGFNSFQAHRGQDRCPRRPRSVHMQRWSSPPQADTTRFAP